KNRVRQYFQSSRGKSPKIQRMVEQISWFEYIVVDSEMEALILECNLIKEHQPKYNTMLKDDKHYPYIRVTVNEEYPRIMLARERKKDKAKYFGPYTSAQAVHDSIDLLKKTYFIRSCNKVLPRDTGKERPCLYYHMGQCKAPCQGYISKEEYRENIGQVEEFLNGNYTLITKRLEQQMMKFSEEMEFEKAAEYRDYITVVKTLAEMIAFHNDMSKRDRKRKKEAMEERPTARSLSRTESFVSTFVPLVGKTPAEGRPLRVEAYDISHIAGTDSVGAMVVFTDGKAEKKAYRRFRIHTVEGADDTASLQEMLYRRLRRGLAEDPGFVPLPDLILMDGGKNQVNAAEKVVAAMKLNIPVAGMAKDDHHRSRALIFRGQEHALNVVPGLRRWIPEIQEEVHRFAIEYHRGLRSGGMKKSVLDNVPGIGEKRKLALLEKYKSIEAIAAASVEELRQVPGMDIRAAEAIKEYFA
ncbi:MAG: excinuclease ABC subunit UvrC, partial [Firmicutes bacterium]|nr:excinuclease ABC subunit UvrC [Bacillota bacterium]